MIFLIIYFLSHLPSVVKHAVPMLCKRVKVENTTYNILERSNLYNKKRQIVPNNLSFFAFSSSICFSNSAIFSLSVLPCSVSAHSIISSLIISSPFCLITILIKHHCPSRSNLSSVVDFKIPFFSFSSISFNLSSTFFDISFI